MKKIHRNFIFISLFIFVLALPNLHPVEAKGKISNGSGIAGISLEGMNFEEAKKTLEDSVAEWLSKDPIVATSEYEKVVIPREVFDFDIDDSLHELDERTKREWSNFFMKKKNIQIPLNVELSPGYMDLLDWSDSINVQKTLDKALLIASNLQDSEIVLEYNESATLEQVELAAVTHPLPEASIATMIRLTEELNGKVLSGGEAFSFLEQVVLPQGLANSEVEMSFVASGLYELALQTELVIVERHPAEVKPTFTEPGLEAIVNREDEKNLLLYNPTSNAYTIHAEIVEDELVMSIHSKERENRFTYIKENIKDIEPRTIYRYSHDLSPNEQEVITEGIAGVQLEIHRQKQSESGAVEDSELIARDFYPPQHEVILVSAMEEELVEEEVVEPEVETGSNNFQSIVEGDDFEQKLNTIIACNDDPLCESENVVSATDKMIAACFLDAPTENQDLDSSEKQEENGFCNLLYLMIFFSLFSEEGYTNEVEEQIVSEDPAVEDNTEQEDALQNDDIDEEVE